MSKRRINKQQSTRIVKNQREYQHSDNDSLNEGLVITSFSKSVKIEDSKGVIIRCSIRPHLETLVAGDRIIWQSSGDSQGVVVSLYPRSTVLARPTSAGREKPVAANITQLVIVVASKPEMSGPLLDSYLIMAELLKLKAVIILNKVDLPSESLQAQLIKNYQPLDYPLVFISNKENTGLAQLKELLKHQVSVVVGQSGVGKSSLIARILPNEKNIAIGEISSGAQLGKHTTSNSYYYHLPGEGSLIDSPGVREFKLGLVNQAQIGQGYREFIPYLSQCKFRNCTHFNTPNCAILQAVASGNISSQRYQNFIKLCLQLDNKLSPI